VVSTSVFATLGMNNGSGVSVIQVFNNEIVFLVINVSEIPSSYESSRVSGLNISFSINDSQLITGSCEILNTANMVVCLIALNLLIS